MNYKFTPADPNKIDGSSFHGDIVYATPNELKHILGEPSWEHNDGEDKTNMEWYMQLEDGNVFTVYDYKEGKQLHPNGRVEWHIGGHSRFDTHLAKQLLSTALQQAKDELDHQMNFKRAYARLGNY
jgi:hypothetical protein